MISQERSNAARINGAKSRGPVTPEGKKRSSMNGLTHGLCARSVIIGKESEEAFNTMLKEHLAWFSPCDGVERAVIEEMVAAKWRQLRAMEIEDEWLEQELDGQESSLERARIAGAFGTLADKTRIALIGRYETRMYRMYH